MNNPGRIRISLVPIMQISAAAASAITSLVTGLGKVIRTARSLALDWSPSFERSARKLMEREYRATGQKIPGSDRTARLRKKRKKALREWWNHQLLK